MSTPLYQIQQRGNFVMIGNTLAQDVGPGVAAPVTGTVGTVSTNTSDTAPDAYWQSNAPSAGAAQANTSIAALDARSAAELTVPMGATVTKAFLFWGSTG